jgi:hypothetical protein
MVIAVDADITDIAMLCVFFGESVAFLTIISKSLHMDSRT